MTPSDSFVMDYSLFDPVGIMSRYSIRSASPTYAAAHQSAQNPNQHLFTDVTENGLYERTYKSSNESARKENCCDKFLTCLSHVPCASLIAWIILLLGLGGLTGSLLYGVTKCRKIMEDGSFWWFMEFTVIGVVVIMFVLGTLFLVIAHLSSDPTNRYVFNTSKKNMCARGLNVFVLFVAYFLAVIWVAGSSLAVMPLLVSTFILSTDFKKGDCIEMKYYGLDKKVCDPELEIFLKEGKELFTCYIFTYVSSVLVTISMIHFLISISANYTHLKDSRFATYNAYDTEEVRNSKHSILDTNM